MPNRTRYFVRTDNDNRPMILYRIIDWGHGGADVWNVPDGDWRPVADRQATLIALEPGVNSDYDEVDGVDVAGIIRQLLDQVASA